ncbi:Hypothetical predicted protein, partial [Paramuricea clavata]
YLSSACMPTTQFIHIRLFVQTSRSNFEILPYTCINKITQPSSTNQKLLSSCIRNYCKETGLSLSNGVYQLRNNDSLEQYQVYCHMTGLSGCGQGGLTLLMKVDGHKNDFNYSSPYWTNKEAYVVGDGLEGFE